MISVVIPLLNEAGNLKLLHQKLTDSLQATDYPYELIFVNDGSTDESPAILNDLFEQDPLVRVIHFQQNFGKTAALVAGFRHSRGEIIITMDADLQDDPAEIPAMLAPLNQGYDLVAAWRSDRHDPVDKTLPSKIFNWVVSRASGLHLHDFNCGFKVYRRIVTEQIPLYSDFHRFVPMLAAGKGFNITEVQVQHHPRHSGVSKYGAGRAVRGFLDFVNVLFLTKYLKHPLRLFGSSGLLIFGLGFLIELYLTVLWLLRAIAASEIPPIGTRPLFTVGVLAMILGIQLFSTGLLGEMLRYFTFKPDQEYVIKQLLSRDKVKLTS
ncbi:MAG TPA: glycosyltransferase family 2 protein [Anaerolineae bacterium]|nr:glycosyltransferase family 2 protein [Anaerolineae bacterium]HMR67823.1 glycosyltransferase family 2 protein [Anaerolineae bacterium]